MKTVEPLLSAAKTHGLESEPDHEVGDLQDALRVAWELMSKTQRELFLQHDDVVAVLAWGGR